MKKKSVLLLCILACLNVGCRSLRTLNHIVDQKLHTVEELHEDVDFVYHTLTAQHPGVHWYVSEQTLKNRFDSLKSTLSKPMKSRDLYLKLAPVVASVNCGHTRLNLVTRAYTSKERDSITKVGSKPIFQFSYLIKAQKLFVKKNNSEDSTLKAGTEILSINDIAAAEIIKTLENAIPSDGYNITFKEAVLNRAFPNWYTNFYGYADSLNFKYATGSSVLRPRKAKQVSVKTVKLSEVDKDAKKKAAKEAKRLRYKGLDENKKPLLEWYFLNPDSSAAYLKVKSFSFPHADFDKFYKEAFMAFSEGGTQDLVIDIRDNGGGSLAACRNLFAYLTDEDFVYIQPAEAKGRFVLANGSISKTLMAPLTFLVNAIGIKKEADGKYYAKIKGQKPLHPKPYNFKGRIFVLVNGFSFSASTLFSANVMGRDRAIFVGTETGGGYNQCTAGRIPVVNLPNSLLQLRYGLYKIAPVVQTTTQGRGIFPQVAITRTVEDDIRGRDPELEYVLKKIKEKENVRK